MTVRKFVAANAREALRKVKAELGSDAIVVSNKAVEGGVEIVAMSADSLDALSQQTAPRQASPPSQSQPRNPGDQRAPTMIAPSLSAAASSSPRPMSHDAAFQAATRSAPAVSAYAAALPDDDYTVSLSSKARAQAPFRAWQPSGQAAPPDALSPRPAAAAPSERAQVHSATVTEFGNGSGAERPRLRPLPGRQSERIQSESQVADTLGGMNSDGMNAEAQRLKSFVDQAPMRTLGGEVPATQLMAEMHAIKTLLERQLSGFAWGDLSRDTPVKALLMAEMLDAGFSGQLARRLIEGMPPDLPAEAGRKWLQAGINRRLRTLATDADIIDRGGVFALVGPTGVGKTTTTAKLAARCVVRYGADRLALLTTDSYRIGAHEQLRIYGRILGVAVHVVRDSEDLRRTLHELRNRHMVLIDTVGMSQRDRMVAEQAAMLTRGGEVNRLLLLSATSRGDTLDDVIRAYSGEDLAGVILTKIDEAASLAPALDAVVRHGLLLTHVANGQRVPEDLHLPNRSYLLHRAFKLQQAESPHRLREEEIGLSMQPEASSDLRAALV